LRSAWGRSAPVAAAVAAAAIGRSGGPSCQCRRMGRRRKVESGADGGGEDWGTNVIPFCWRDCATDCGSRIYPTVMIDLNRSFWMERLPESPGSCSKWMHTVENQVGNFPRGAGYPRVYTR
jgi:hypothetical protein